MDANKSLDAYRIGEKVADADGYRTYLCVQKETARQCLLQISTTAEHNGRLGRAAYVLGELKRRSDELEEEYARVKTDQKILLNYDLGFPELLESFDCQEQGGRRINILAFRKVEDASKMVPVCNITAKDRLRVDLRTSVWIMGKLLKLLAFAHSEAISTNLLAGGNVLIEPDQHYVLIFDWSAAQLHQEMIPKEIRRQEISQAAKTIITVLGGDPETGTIPNGGEEAFSRYTDYLLLLAQGNESDASKAHAKFYEIADSFWKREFYPFTTKPLI